jgi:Threonine synthase
MKFISTRGDAAPVTLSEAILQGLAPDGGLFVPERMPALSLKDFPPVRRWRRLPNV